MKNSGKTATLHLTYGTMAAGKSTLALQLVWQLREHSEKVALWTFGDRSGSGLVTSRIGISAEATPIVDSITLKAAVNTLLVDNVRVLVIDEAQFASTEDVEVLVDLVDVHNIAVHCFALATDFQGEVFEGTAKLFAFADAVAELPLATYCWCGERGRCNARIVDGKIVRTGKQIVIGDTVEVEDQVKYQVLCRRHYRSGTLKEEKNQPQISGANETKNSSWITQRFFDVL